MIIPAGQKLKLLIHENGELVKIGHDFEGLQLHESGYINLKTKLALEPIMVISQTLDFDIAVKIDDSDIVISSVGETYCKYIAFIN